jgi:hypothetical protein
MRKAETGNRRELEWERLKRRRGRVLRPSGILIGAREGVA